MYQTSGESPMRWHEAPFAYPQYLYARTAAFPMDFVEPVLFFPRFAPVDLDDQRRSLWASQLHWLTAAYPDLLPYYPIPSAHPAWQDAWTFEGFLGYWWP